MWRSTASANAARRDTAAQSSRRKDNHGGNSAALIPTIFHEPWWLEAATGGSYLEVSVVEGGTLAGRMPFAMEEKLFRQRTLVMPTLTHVLGPALSPDVVGDGNVRSLRPINITRRLIDQLPAAAHIWFELHRGIDNTLAFEEAGFSCGVNFTVDIPPDAPDVLWHRMRDKTRNVIRRARDVLLVSDEASPGVFMDFYEENLRARNLRNSYDRRQSEALISTCIRRGKGRLLIASDANGAAEAAIFTVWDDHSEYFLMSSRRREAKGGAISLLLWMAIQHAAGLDLNFDVDRVNSRTNLLLLTGFGGAFRPRYFVSRSTATFQMGRRIRATFVGLTCRSGKGFRKDKSRLVHQRGGGAA